MKVQYSCLKHLVFESETSRKRRYVVQIPEQVAHRLALEATPQELYFYFFFYFHFYYIFILAFFYFNISYLIIDLLFLVFLDPRHITLTLDINLVSSMR